MTAWQHGAWQHGAWHVINLTFWPESVDGLTGDWQQTLRNEESVAGTRVIIIYYESGNFHIIGPICTRKLFAKFIAK